MQYVGQTCRALQKRFGEHYRRMKKPKPIDTFLYQHFKRTGHSPNDVLVQPVEKLTYDKNSSSRFKIIKRHETELKWIKLLQTPFPLGFNDNIYHEGNISKMPDFDVFSLLEIRKRKSRSHGIRKKGNGKRKKRAVKRSNTSLKDLSKVLEGVTKCMHRTAPGKTQYRTDGNSRNLPTNSVPDLSISLILGMSIVGRFLEIIVYMCVGSVRWNSIWLTAQSRIKV